jgi:ribonucleotide reductase beta subunit family protein with ferritin-like domain
MDTLDNTIKIDQKPKRSQFLKVLCILTFVFTGFSFLTSIIGLFSGPASPEMMTQQHVQMAQQIAQLQEVHADSFVYMFQQLQQFIVC